MADGKDKGPISAFLASDACAFSDGERALLQWAFDVLNYKEQRALALLWGVPTRTRMEPDTVALQMEIPGGAKAALKFANRMYARLGCALIARVASMLPEWWRNPRVEFHDVPSADGTALKGVTLFYPDGTTTELAPVAATLSIGEIKDAASEHLRVTWNHDRKCRVQPPSPPSPPPPAAAGSASLHLG